MHVCIEEYKRKTILKFTLEPTVKLLSIGTVISLTDQTRKEQSDLELCCLPFCLELLDALQLFETLFYF